MLDHSACTDYPPESSFPLEPVFDTEELIFGPLDMDDGRRYDPPSPSRGMRQALSPSPPSMLTRSPLPPRRLQVCLTLAPLYHRATQIFRSITPYTPIGRQIRSSHVTIARNEPQRLITDIAESAQRNVMPITSRGLGSLMHPPPPTLLLVQMQDRVLHL